MDFGNDDDFQTSWLSNKTVAKPWYEIDFDNCQSFNMVTIMDSKQTITKYRLEYQANGEWKNILSGEGDQKIKIHRFDRVWGSKIRIVIDQFTSQPSIAEFGVYNEQR
jgi:alpha-L-fucosidase